MLSITVPLTEEMWDDINEVFIPPVEKTLCLEHSLVSLSKWESIWHKPFLSKEQKTSEETESYIKCMTITQNVDPEIYKHLTLENIKQVNEYITDSMTATWFSEDKQKGKTQRNKEQITSELIYYWMISLNIPVEFQKWHLNRLLTLIRVCNIKNQPPKKKSKSEIAANYAALNAARRKQLNSKG